MNSFTTITFQYPLVLFSPLLFLALTLFIKAEKRRALFPQVALLKEAGVSIKLRLRTLILPLLCWTFIIALALAAARPQMVSFIEQTQLSTSLMLVLDISPSMGAEDFAPGMGGLSRLDGVKSVVSEFIGNRPSDRMGLVAFGGRAFLQSPLTLDHTLLKQLISRIAVGMAGDGTAIGDGLGLALKHMQDIPAKSKAIILLTDGVSNAGQVNPLKAAKVAKDLGVKIHTIGIGSNGPINMNIPGALFSQSIQTQADYDEKTLREISDISAGVFFNAKDIQGLKQVYREIDKLEASAEKDPQRRIVQELFTQYALVALVSYILYLLLANTVFMKVP